MPDPIDELEGFTVTGLSPAPPSQVRRRGDRLRRRRNALVATGCVAVVAIIAAPLAVLAGRQAPAEPEPAPAPSWTTRIPSSFDLTAVPSGSQVDFVERPDQAVTLTLCGAPAFSTGAEGPAGAATDSARAGYGEVDTESAGARTLAVYADDETASVALAELRSAVEDCPVDDTGATTYHWAVVDAPTLGDESMFFSQQVQFDPTLTTDLVLAEVVREGNALLLATTHTSAGGDQAVRETLPALTELTAPVVDQMCAFSADPC